MRLIDADEFMSIAMQKLDMQDMYFPSDVLKLIDEVPTVEVKQEWIPLSEREPEGAAHVLISYKWSDYDYDVGEEDYGVLKHCISVGLDEEGVIQDQINHAVAWMPMPLPYKEEE